MPPDKQRKEPRLSNGTIGLMIGFACFFDILEGLIGLIPVLGWGINIFIDFIVFIILWSWFKYHKVNFTGMRTLIFFALGHLKYIPVIEEFPLWILDVVAICTMVRTEDLLNIRLNKQNVSVATGALTKGLAAAAKNKKIAGFLDKSERGKNFRQQIIAAQKQSLPEQKQLNEEKKTRPASPKIEEKAPLPKIGRDNSKSL